MTDPQIPDNAQGAGADRLAALAARVGPSIQAVRRRSAWLLLAAVLFVLAASLAAAYWVGAGFLHARQVVTVPDLTGKTLEQTLDLLAPLKLGLSKETVQFDEGVPPGSVLRQSPPPGVRVREGKILLVTLSSGGQVVFVPDLTGLGLTEAQNRLRAAGFVLGAQSGVYSVRSANGIVMAQEPAPNNVAKPGAMVDLKVSRGPPPEGTVLMPDFVQKPFALARQWARDQDVVPEVQQEVTDLVLPGLVIRQSPAPDSPIGPQASVSFAVAKSTGSTRDVTLVRYQVPAGSDRVLVRLVLRDDLGEREVYSAEQSGGSLVEAPVSPEGLARIRIFVDGVLVEERPL